MSIAKKVTLVVTLLASILLLGAGYAASILGEQELMAGARERARVLADVIRASAEGALDDFGRLGTIADRVSRSGRAEVLFYGRDGRRVAPVPVEETPVVSARALRVMERNASEWAEVAWGNQRGVLLREPLRQRGRPVGALEIRLALAPPPLRSRVGTALAVAGVLLLLFAGAVAVFSRNAIERPVARLMGGMDQITRGDLTAALPLDRSDEIGRIAYRFNEMTARLAAAQEEIRASAAAKLALEQRLLQSEKLATVGQLSAEIAHEVGTPLNVIGGRARVLSRKAEHPEEVRKNARIIGDQTARITKIIQQMLDITRARVPERRAVDAGEIVDTALAFLEYQMELAGVRLTREPAEALPPVWGDPDGLQQVFLNLLLNAIQSMPRGGTLAVSLAREHRRKQGLDLSPPRDHVVVTIDDSGPGVPEAVRQRIFDPFYSTKAGGEGTGLGLTVVAGIVKDHDGWVEVGESPAGGARFRVHLPARRPGSESQEWIAQEAAGAG